MSVPPNPRFHPHCNTGSTPACPLAFKDAGASIRDAQGVPQACISRRVGGDQIDCTDESERMCQGFPTR